MNLDLPCFFMVYYANTSFKTFQCALVKNEITSHINLLQMEQMELTCVEHPICTKTKAVEGLGTI